MQRAMEENSRHVTVDPKGGSRLLKSDQTTRTGSRISERSRGQSGPVGALVTGADYRALGVVRSLGRHDIPVWVLRKPDHLLAALSRYTQRSIPWPPGNEAEQVRFLLKLAAEHNLQRWLLFPTDDEAVGFIARHHESLASRFELTIPCWRRLQGVCDKRRLHQLASQLQLDQPWTFCPHSRTEVESLGCVFPVIIKPALRESCNPLTTDKAWQVEGRSELLARYDEACTLLSPDLLMIQEVIPGGGETQFSYAALCHHGQPLASIVARRTRQFPMDFGRFSTYAQTVEEPQVAEAATRLIQALDYTGLIEVEFKRDPRDGRFKLLDVNPRVWGWHTLGARAGVDFSYLLWRLLQGEPVTRTQGRPGVGWVRLPFDVCVGIQEIRRGRVSMQQYLRSLLGPIELAVLAIDDPLPGLLELPLLAYIRGKRFLR